MTGDIEQLGQLLMALTKTPQEDTSEMLVGLVEGVGENLKVRINVPQVTGEGPGYIVLTRDYLILGALCQETWIPKSYIDEQTHTHEYHHGDVSGEISQIQQIMLWRGLRVGDKVLMIKLNRGQLYYIVQRVEGCVAN